MRASLSLTDRCNLRCRYCYSGGVSGGDMSLDTARKAVDFVLDIAPDGEVTNLGYFGGEPLMRPEAMTEITAYVRRREAESGKRVRLTTTTNGVLLEGSVLDFLRQADIQPCVSIDGPEHVHNRNRRYPGGRGTFADVLVNLRRAIDQLDYVQVNAVYGPDTARYLRDTVAFLADLGPNAIHLNPNITAPWPDEAREKLWDAFADLADIYIDSYRRGQELALNTIDSKVIALLKRGLTPEDRCRMGECEWGFAPNGDIYPCERFIGNGGGAAYCLGNVHTGLNAPRQSWVVAGRGNGNPECEDCNLRRYCNNTCGCTNFHTTGHSDVAAPMLCASERAAINAGKLVLTTLHDDELFLRHFMRYLDGGCG